jgi:predicted SprT family Zn-dependent metalloprotease
MDSACIICTDRTHCHSLILRWMDEVFYVRRIESAGGQFVGMDEELYFESQKWLVFVRQDRTSVIEAELTLLVFHLVVYVMAISLEFQVSIRN